MNILLVEPLIPQNTGNISRLCAGTNTDLHLVQPLGFSLEDRYLKRAGLDYWPHVKLHLHDSLDDALAAAGDAPMAFFSSHATKAYTAFEPTDDAWLVFGKETTGLGEAVRQQQADRLYTIPMTDHVRSLNLSNCAALCLYHCLAKLGFPGM